MQLKTPKQQLTEDGRLSLKIRGPSLAIYYLLIQSSEAIGVREIARILDLKSPSLAQYHLQKLEDEELIEKTLENKYYVENPVIFGPLKHYYNINRKFIPRSVFTAIMATTIFFIGTWTLLFNITPEPIIVGITLLSFLLAFLTWNDVLTWKQSTIFKKKKRMNEE